MATAISAAILECADCKTKAKTHKLPPGWKRHQGEVCCKVCWRKKYILRAVEFPIAGPVNMAWEEFRPILNQCWADSTALTNWCVNHRYGEEKPRMPDDKKLAKAPANYLYPEARRKFPQMDPQSIVACLHAADGKYRKKRLDVVWRSAAALPSHRYPVPYPIHNQGWKARYATPEDEGVPDKSPLVRVRLQGQEVLLRLRGGTQYRRQLASFAKIVSGEALAGELAIYRRRANESAHRNGLQDREPAGGARAHYRIMCKMVAWLPRNSNSSKPLTKQASLTTSRNALLTMTVEDREPWILHMDHVPRWIKDHRRYLDRMSDDTKFEKRWPARTRRQMNEARERRCQTQKNRLRTAIQQAAAMACEFARRQGVAEILYDDTDKSFVAEFPWFQLKERIKQKADEIGIIFTDVASGEVVDETPGAARGDESDGPEST